MIRFACTGIVIALALTGCDKAPEASSAQAAPPTPAIPIPPPAPTIVPGGPGQSLAVPAPPGAALKVAEAAEYQIDVMGAGDPKAFLYRGEVAVASDDDSGEDRNARIVAPLEAGDYMVRVQEVDAKVSSFRVQAQKLAPLEAVGTIAPGGSISVATRSGTDDRSSSVEVTLAVTAAGPFTIDAKSDEDVKMALRQAGRTIAEDDDGGEDTNARITQSLNPGTYQIRLWHIRNDGAKVELLVR